MELVVKVSRRHSWKGRASINQAKDQGAHGQRGGGQSGYFLGRGRSGREGGIGGRGGRDGGHGGRMEVEFQTLQDRLILRLVMSVGSEVISPVTILRQALFLEEGLPIP